jgi:hypothetical protein
LVEFDKKSTTSIISFFSSSHPATSANVTLEPFFFFTFILLNKLSINITASLMATISTIVVNIFPTKRAPYIRQTKREILYYAHSCLFFEKHKPKKNAPLKHPTALIGWISPKISEGPDDIYLRCSCWSERIKCMKKELLIFQEDTYTNTCRFAR